MMTAGLEVNTKANMETLTLHQQDALRDVPVAADALLK